MNHSEKPRRWRQERPELLKPRRVIGDVVGGRAPKLGLVLLGEYGPHHDALAPLVEDCGRPAMRESAEANSGVRPVDMRGR